MNYFNFNGLATRQEYWAIMIITILIIAIGMVLVEAASPIGALAALIILIGSLWLYLATTVRRLRDAGLSVWWVLTTFIPYVAIVATVVFGVLSSKEQE